MTLLMNRTPNAKLIEVDKALLETGPPRLVLDLPSDLSVTINRRSDVTDMMAAAVASEDGVNTASAVGDGVNGTYGSEDWVGEVEGAAGPFSAVVFVVAADNTVHGNIRFYDKKARRIRTFRVVPTSTGRPHPITAAAARSPREAALFPEFNPSIHLVVEYRESTQPRKFRVDSTPPKPRAEFVDSNPRGGAPSPVQLPDPAALAIAMAESAGPSAEAFLAAAASSTAAAASALPESAVGNTGSQGPDQGGAGTTGARRKLMQSGSTRQDLLAVFTAAAATRVGGVSIIENQIRTAVDMTNKAYVDSGVPVVVNLVAIRQVAYNEAGRDVIGEIKDNKIPNVFAWRDEVRAGSGSDDQQEDKLAADLVTIFNDNTGVCGVAWMPVAQNLAFSAVMRGCFTGYTLAHELGHNQGCGHNIDDLKTDPGAGNTLWGPYAWGFRRCDLGSNNFKTILSYGCPNGVRSPEVGMFSTPFRRTPSGVAIGDINQGYCAWGIQNSSRTVAAFRSGNIPPPPPPPPPPTTSSNRSIRSGMGNRCVDAPTWTTGVQLYIFDCHGGPNQQFEHRADGSVRFVGRNQCMDVRYSGTADGTAVQLWECNGTPAQQWFADHLGRLHPYAAPDKCLDIPNSRFENRVNLVIWSCHTYTNQNWTSPFMTPRPAWNPRDVMIKSRLNNLVLDVSGYNYTNGGPVVMWGPGNQPNQRWVIDDRGRLRSAHNTNKCLAAASASNAAPVYIFDCQDGANQRWFQDPLSRLRPYNAVGRALDIIGANSAQGTRVQLWTAVDVNQQKWYL
eukprot:gene7981-8179_t